MAVIVCRCLFVTALTCCWNAMTECCLSGVVLHWRTFVWCPSHVGLPSSPHYSSSLPLACGMRALGTVWILWSRRRAPPISKVFGRTQTFTNWSRKWLLRRTGVSFNIFRLASGSLARPLHFSLLAASLWDEDSAGQLKRIVDVKSCTLSAFFKTTELELDART